ncbi:serine/threonine-protein kinase [Ornithinimicrobium avium]|nr:serine/threonine-protein kinase [Ornithinimicrobium avium]
MPERGPGATVRGQVLAGRVELLDPVGEGGGSVVWRARDLRTGEVVAAKLLRQAEAGSLLRFVQESSTRIRHDHVLAPMTWVAEDGQVALLMELVGGGSVASLVGDFGALPPLLAAELLRQACEGLQAVHEAGVVHRDVTPANLLLRATGAGRPHLLLSDFGVAVRLDGPRLTRVDRVVGTPGYSAPEQERGGDPAPAQDLYALGRVAHEMLTGLRPQPDVPDVDLSGSLPREAPPVLRDLVRSLLAPDVRDRPVSASDARARLDHPDLAWRQGAMGEVEVLDHLAEEDPPPEDPLPRPGARSAREVTGEQAGGPVVALAAVAILSAAVLLWALVQLL